MEYQLELNLEPETRGLEMSPARIRVRRKATTEQAEFNPEAIASGISTGEERVNPEEQFYDSAADPDYNSTVQTPEPRGPHPDGDDDGSQDGDGYQTGDEVETVDQEDAENGEDEGNDSDTDPSSAQPLGRTVAGMTQGQQAAQAELKDYMRRLRNLATEKGEIEADMKELKKEIKSKGYDLKAFDIIFKLSDLDEGDKDKIRDQKAINQTYAKAVGVDEDLV